jgi:hypothetical protein
VIVEVVPAGVRASAIGLFLFFMNQVTGREGSGGHWQVGGNLPVAISPLREALGGDYRCLGPAAPSPRRQDRPRGHVARLPRPLSRPLPRGLPAARLLPPRPVSPLPLPSSLPREEGGPSPVEESGAPLLRPSPPPPHPHGAPPEGE